MRKITPDDIEQRAGKIKIIYSEYQTKMAALAKKHTLRHSANVDGDSDSIASIACAMSGAYNGAGVIPQHLIDGLKDVRAIDLRIEKLKNFHGSQSRI